MAASQHKTLALYARYSLEEATQDSMSIENQLACLRDYVRRLPEYETAEILTFSDDGYSGTNFERPAMTEMLELVKASKIDCILVKDLSRFGRNSTESRYFVEMVFPLFQTRLIAVNDRFDSGQYEEDTGGMEIAFTYFMNEFYSRDLSVKSKSAKYAKMRRGEYQSKICCYGYRKGSDGRMEVDPEAAKMVKEIYALAAQGRTITQIIQYLYAEKVPTPGEYKAMQGIQTYDISRCNYAWDRTRLLSMLRDERYIGTYIIGKRTVREVGSSRVRMKNESEWFKIPDHHPAIVEKAVFEQVQAILPSFKCPKKAERSYALRGKVFCGCCDHALSRNAKKIPNFYCRYAITLPDSHHGGIQIDDAELEAALFAMIAKQAQIILNMDSITDVSQLSIQTERMTEYERQIQARQAEKRRLYERYICREISLQTYQAEKSVQNEEETQLRSCYTRLSQKVQQTQMSREQQTTQRRLASDVQAQSTLTRELADTLIDRVTVYPDNQIEVCWKLKDFCT